MSSFLQKLKGKGVGVTEDHTATQANLPVKSDIPSGVTQLAVDVRQNDGEIVIFAQVPGTEIKDLDVSIEGDNDVITIQGSSFRPEDLVDGKNPPEPSARVVTDADHNEFTLEECVWGKFFRQIILPQEVDATAAHAKLKDGVLVLHLPLKGHSTNRLRMHVERVESN